MADLSALTDEQLYAALAATPEPAPTPDNSTSSSLLDYLSGFTTSTGSPSFASAKIGYVPTEVTMQELKPVVSEAAGLGGSLIGAEIGAGYGTSVAPFLGPFAPAGPFIGAGLGGALGYLVPKAGTEIAIDAVTGQPVEVGAALSEALPTAALTGGLETGTRVGMAALPPSLRTIGKGLELLRALGGNKQALERLATQEIARAAGPSGVAAIETAQMMPELLTGTGASRLTAAEIAQTPNLAALQQKQRLLEAGRTYLEPTLQTRESELLTALNKFGLAPQQGEMALVMQQAAQKQAAEKSAKEADLLAQIVPGEVRNVTKMERGTEFRTQMQALEDASNKKVREAWESVPKKTQIDASVQLQEAVKLYNSFGTLSKQALGAEATRVVKQMQTLIEDKVKKTGATKPISVTDWQDLRSAAGRAMTDADGMNEPTVRLMSFVREQLDNVGETTAASLKEFKALSKYREAISETRRHKEMFARGVVGDVLATRRFQPKLKESQLVDKILQSPENIVELTGKIGADSAEMIGLRGEMVNRLEAAASPTEFLTKHQDTFIKLFDQDFGKLAQYANSRAQGAPLGEFLNVTDTMIPSRIFNDAEQTKRFVTSFKNTPAVDFAKARFINERIVKGDAVGNLAKNKQIARNLFGEQYGELESVVGDLQLSRTPQQLENLASRGQSITAQRLTTLGQLTEFRNIAKAAQSNGTSVGAIIGAVTGGSEGGVSGALLGYWMRHVAGMSLEQYETLMAKMLADPSMIKFASEQPNKQNIEKFLGNAVRSGYFAARLDDADASNNLQPQSTTPVGKSLSQALPVNTSRLESMSDAEIEALLNPTSTTAAKNDVQALVTGRSKLVQAVVAQESGGNVKAKSPAGAVGLMQLMPATAKAYGVTDRTDPQQSLDAGEKYLRDLYKQFDDVELTLAAYNWGPGNVRKALKKIKAKGQAETWDNVLRFASVPNETSNYVAKVLNNYQKLEG